MSLWRGTLCTNCKKEHECAEAERMFKSGGIVHGCSACVPKPVTKADKIRAMTDRELSNFIVDLFRQFRRCPEDERNESVCVDSTCDRCWLEWLRKEAE